MDRASGLLPRGRRRPGELLADNSGLILPCVTRMPVVIAGRALRAGDGSRALGLAASLQKGADAAEPANAPPNTSVWAELAGLVKPGTDEGRLHDIVRLYR